MKKFLKTILPILIFIGMFSGIAHAEWWSKGANTQLYTNSGNGLGNAIINVAGCNGCAAGGGITPAEITLTNSHIIVGTAGGVGRDVALTLSGTGGTFSLANTGVLTMPNADATTRGLLLGADFATFAAKENALTFSTGLTRTVNTITSNLSTGIAGGQSAIGGTAASENLTLSSTSNGTKGKLILGSASAYDEVNDRLGIGLTSPSYNIDVTNSTKTVGSVTFSGAGLNDMTTSGTYTGTRNRAIIVTLDAASAVKTIASAPTSGGTGYTAGDVITITTGGGNATITVNTVNGSGVITALNTAFPPDTRGSGYSTGAGQATSGGTGTGATVNITAVADTFSVSSNAISQSIGNVIIAASPTSLGFGVSITFAAAIGHTLNNTWSFNETVNGLINSGNSFYNAGVFFGAQSVSSSNVYIGNVSGEGNLSGTLNTFMGVANGQLNTGSNNTFLGARAGRFSTTAGTSVMVGANAGVNTTTGNQNVFIGSAAGQTNTTGGQNTIVGGNGAGAITTGNANTIIGNSGAGLSTGSSQITIGYKAIATASNQVVFGGDDGTLGSINNVYFGQGVQAPSGIAAQANVTIQSTGGRIDGSDRIASNLTLAAGKSTGAGSPASLILSTSTATSTGTTLQTLSERWRISGPNNGNLSNTGLDGTAYLHLAAGTATASTAPLKFTSGTLQTTAEVGAVEFLTDKFYGTITTGAVRKEITLNDTALTSGTIPVATTNGRLTDSSFTTTSLTSSKYTPVATNVTNITSSTPNNTTYSRVGNVVTEAGSITVTNTLAVASEVDISLGIASNLAAATDLNGTATMDSTASVNMYITGDATNDRAKIFFTSAGVGQTSTIYYSLQYTVI